MTELMKAYQDLAKSIARLAGRLLETLAMLGAGWNLYTGELDRALVFAVLFAGLAIALTIEDATP